MPTDAFLFLEGDFLGLSMPSLTLMAVFIVVVAFLLLRSQRYYARPRPYDQPRQHPSFVSENKGHHLDAPDEVVGWEVQMHEIARDMKAELDTKMRALQALIAEADRAAARLENALDASGSGKTAAFSPKVGLKTDGLSAKSPSATADQAESLKTTGGTAASAARQEEILTLHAYGLPPREIAGRTGVPIGEVELVLNLRGKKSGA